MSKAKQAAGKGVSYADAGVDISAGNALVDAIKPLARSTRRKGADSALGGFGGLFDLKACGFKDPVLVAANDGVGTKLRIAIETGRHHGVGIDLVAMSVNDLVVQGAEPLFFLDYFATGKLNSDQGAAIVGGIAEDLEADRSLYGLFQPKPGQLRHLAQRQFHRGAIGRQRHDVAGMQPAVLHGQRSSVVVVEVARADVRFEVRRTAPLALEFGLFVVEYDAG